LGIVIKPALAPEEEIEGIPFERFQF